MRTITVSCPKEGRIEIDSREVMYSPNGDGTAIYSFDCEPCWTTHTRHATIADLNMFRISGCKSKEEFDTDARKIMYGMYNLSEAEIDLFALEINAINDVVGEIL